MIGESPTRTDGAAKVSIHRALRALSARVRDED